MSELPAPGIHGMPEPWATAINPVRASTDACQPELPPRRKADQAPSTDDRWAPGTAFR